MLGDLDDFVHGGDEGLGGGEDFAAGRTDLLRGGGDFLGGGLLLAEGRGHLGDGLVDTDAGFLHATDEGGEVVAHAVEAPGELAELVLLGEESGR